MSYALSGLGQTSPAQWKKYVNARAQACTQYADEGACLARVSRLAPVTIVPAYGGLGQTATDIASGASLIAGLISNPTATLQQRGPAIVTALDSYIVGPVVQAAVERSTPYLVAYFGPPLVTMYVMTALSTWFSYEVLTAYRRGALKANRGRRRKKR